MRIDYKKYEIKTDKDVNITIAHIADIHFAKNYKLKRLEIVKNRIKEIKPNYICITGDLIDTYNITKEPFFQKFEQWLEELAKISKIIISIGNHEYIEKVDNKYVEQKNIDWLKKLQRENIIVLDNDIYSEGNITFIGFNPDHQYYANHEKAIIKKDNLKLYKLIAKTKANYNVLLLHTPFFIFEKENYKKIKEFDKLNLVLCGHTHGGMMASFIPGTFGIISPSKKLFPKNVRGMAMINNTKVIITSGITKLSKKSKLTYLTDIYSSNINEIKIKKIIK